MSPINLLIVDVDWHHREVIQSRHVQCQSLEVWKNKSVKLSFVLRDLLQQHAASKNDGQKILLNENIQAFT